MTKARLTFSIPALILMGVVLGLVTGLLPSIAYAEAAMESSGLEQNWACKDAGTLNQIFCSLTSAFRFSPKFLSIVSYVIAAVLSLYGFMQLKEYGDDPSKTPLRSIIIKFVIATMLISLPLVMQMFMTTVTGEEMGNTGSIARPTLGRGVSGK